MSMTWPDPRLLAVVRMALGVATILNALEMAAILGRVATGSLAMPSLVQVPVTKLGVDIWLSVTVLAGALVLLGVVTRTAALMASTASVAAMLWDRQVYANHIWLTASLLLLLAFSRSGTTWSVEAAAGRRRQATSPAPALLMQSQLSICYLFAALSKLNPWWLAGDELRWSMRVTLPSSLYGPLAVAVVATEVFIAIGIWFRPSRLAALAVGLCLHISIVVLMHERVPLVTFTLVCTSLYPLVATAPRVRDLLGEAWTTAEAEKGSPINSPRPTR